MLNYLISTFLIFLILLAFIVMSTLPGLIPLYREGFELEEIRVGHKRLTFRKIVNVTKHVQERLR